MGYGKIKFSLARSITWLVKLRLDRCDNTFGQTPCTATGDACFYTYPTCKDTVNFVRGEVEYDFSMADGPPVAGALPYVKAFRTVPTEIRPDRSVTRRARLTVDMIDDRPHALADPDKAVTRAETGGSFFRNLIARNPNYGGRIVELWQGFGGLPPSEYRLVFRGVIEKIEWNEGSARVVAKDQLKLLDKKVPPAQSSGNVLTAIYNGGTDMFVTDGSQFGPPGAIKLGDEYVTFEDVSGDTLTGCVPGAYNTTPASHPAGTRAAQALVFADPATGEGLPPDIIAARLLTSHGNIGPLSLATVDRGAALASAVSDVAPSLPLTSTAHLAGSGIARLGDELVVYDGIAAGALSVTERGAFGTTASAHNAGTGVMPLRLSDELGRWMTGAKYRRFVTRPAKIKELVNSLRDQCLLHLWQGEDSTVEAKCVAPPFYTQPPAELNDEDSFIAGSTGWDPGDEMAATRVAVHYAPPAPDPGDDPDDYDGLLVSVDPDVEGKNFFGGPRPKEFFGSWIYREHEALLLASRYLLRYRRGLARFRFALEMKDSGLQVGDFVRVTSRDVIGPDGMPRERALFEVLAKKRAGENRFEYEAVDTRLDRRYPLIAPPEVTEGYDGADPDDRVVYGWVGGAGDKVGSKGDPGYYIY